MSGAIGRGTRWRMALRANLLQSTWNYERQQGIGWAFALQPALTALYRDAATRRAIRSPPIARISPSGRGLGKSPNSPINRR